jgi:hypothetical protein
VKSKDDGDNTTKNSSIKGWKKIQPVKTLKNKNKPSKLKKSKKK